MDGVESVGGDFLEALPPGPFDVVFCGNICHIYGPDQNRALFGRIGSVLRPGGRLAILDFLTGVSPDAAVFAVNMLVNTEGGGVWSAEEYRAWLGEAGLDLVDWVPIEGRTQLILRANRR